MSVTIQTKDQVRARIEANASAIKSFGVKRLGLFGSFVREQQHCQSDVDVLVEFEEGSKTFDNFIELCFFLEDILQRNVELVTPESLSPYIGPSILNEVEYVTLVD